MPHNISINQHLYVICDTPYVIHMLHTPFLHLVITVNQELGKESTKVFWEKKSKMYCFGWYILFRILSFLHLLNGGLWVKNI